MTDETNQTEIKPVDTLVRAGFVQQMARQFRTRAIFVSSPDMTANLKAAFGNQEPKYPYMFLLPQSVSQNTDSYTTNRLARHGIPVSVSVDNKQFQTAKLIPINFDVEVTFITNKYEGLEPTCVDGFIRRWMMARRTGALNFSVDYGLTKLSIATTLADSLAVPRRESPADQESVYQIVATVTIHGFLSEAALQVRGRINQVVLADVAPSGGQFFPF